jgi:hypothetical protein
MVMKDDTKDAIRRARKSATSISQKRNTLDARVPQNRDSPSCRDSFVKTKKRDGREEIFALLAWCDNAMRFKGSVRDRTLMAVRDAARQVLKRGRDPWGDDIYVSSGFADAWNLPPNRLHEGLRRLATEGEIRIISSRKGQHMRFVLTRRPPKRE